MSIKRFGLTMAAIGGSTTFVAGLTLLIEPSKAVNDLVFMGIGLWMWGCVLAISSS